MNKVIIAKMGLEGGGCTIYGRLVDGAWSFWREGTSMYLDENDDEAWRQWATDPVSNVIDALPNIWWLMYTQYVHPDFVTQLRAAFYTHQHERDWQEHRFDDFRRESWR